MRLFSERQNEQILGVIRIYAVNRYMPTMNQNIVQALLAFALPASIMDDNCEGVESN